MDQLLGISIRTLTALLKHLPSEIQDTMQWNIVMPSSYYDHIRDIDMQDDNNCGGTFAEAFDCVE